MTMIENTIKEQFRKLEKRKSGDDTFKVITLPDLQHKLGKSDEGFPKFFICLSDSASYVKNIVREFLSVEYNQRCQVESEGKMIENNYAIVTLQSLEWSLQSTFIDIVMLMLNKIQPIPSRKELAVEVENLITIFSALVNPPVKKMQGLWGELLIIERSKYPEILINAWHNSPKAKFDFTLGCDKIEVKTTSGENRTHKFSLDQLNPAPSSRLLIASMTVRESGAGNGGKSVRNLFDSIYAKVSGCKERLHLYEVMAETIGSDIAKLDSVFFDYSEAVDSLDYFRAKDIPRIDKKDVPAGVTDVKFASNLADVPSVLSLDCIQDYKSSPLFKSLM